MYSHRALLYPTVAAGFMMFAMMPALAQTEPQTTREAPPTVEVSPSETSAPSDEASRNTSVLSAIAKLDPMIGDVQILGPWSAEGKNGVWRTVMTQPTNERSGNRFFLQQVKQNDGVNSIASSTEVTEIAEVGGVVVGYRADAPAEGQENSLTVFFDILPLDGEVSESYELFVSPNEPYRFGPASN